MTPNELDELLTNCQILYHATDEGSWPSIRDHGLLSATALLDRYGISGSERASIEAQRRSAGVRLAKETLPSARLRDQLPMSDEGLRRCLPAHLTPADWYRILNSKVFFWLSHDRLQRLLGAESYAHMNHDVIEVDTRELVGAYATKVWLCPINSGYTKYVPQPRDEFTFRRIEDYPYSEYRRTRAATERVVELAVDYAIPDLAKFVIRVSRRNAAGEIDEIFRR